MKPGHHLANLAMQFLDPLLSAFPTPLVIMSDNGRGFFGTEPYDLLA